MNKIKLSDIKLLLMIFVPEPFQIKMSDRNSSITIDELIEDQPKSKPNVLLHSNDIEKCYSKTSVHSIDYVFDLSQSVYNDSFEYKDFNYINNKNGSIRWVYPRDLKTPTFLSLYNSSYWKSILYCYIIRVLFFFRMESTVSSGGFRVHFKKPLKLDQILNRVSFESFSIFMGSPGVNRKLIIELNSNGSTHDFLKIAISSKSKRLIQNEAQVIDLLRTTPFENIQFPTCDYSNEFNLAIVSNVRKVHSSQVNQIKDLHIKVLLEMYENLGQNIPMSLVEGLGHIEGDLNLQPWDKFPQSSNIKSNLMMLYLGLDMDTVCCVSRAHMDFTPWNMFQNGTQLAVYDWELSEPSIPILYDVFHFVFQSGVLIHHQNYKTIKTELERVMKMPEVVKAVKQYDVDIDLHLKFYLLKNITYYMNLYQEQKKIHEQAFWLVKVWDEALVDVASMVEGTNHRLSFAKSFFLRFANARYALLKFHEESLDNIKDSSDLDVLVERKDLADMICYCSSHPLIKKSKVSTKSFMSTVELYFMDSTFLSLDFIHTFKRKSIRILDEELMLSSASMNENGIKIPEVRYDFEYAFLFYTLNWSSIPEKYWSFYLSLKKIDTNSILHYINAKYGFDCLGISSLLLFSSKRRKKILYVLQREQENRGFRKIINMAGYILDWFKSSQRRIGFTISFSGVDGAGKSTTIDNVVDVLSSQFRRKVVVLRHRPSLLPILSTLKYGKDGAQQKVLSQLPRTGNNKSQLLSIVRFSYYFIDYLLGQFYVYIRHIMAGSIVLYDRYYFDFINDAKRSNLVLPKGLIKYLYWFVFKPKLNFFLYATSDVILQRKQELDKMAIEELTVVYQELFDSYEKKFRFSKYIQIENLDKEKTMSRIMSEISNTA